MTDSARLPSIFERAQALVGHSLPPAMTLDRDLSAVSSTSLAAIRKRLLTGCFECRSTVARMALRGKSAAIVVQCVGCGSQLGPTLATIDHPGRQSYAIFDDAIGAAANQARRAAMGFTGESQPFPDFPKPPPETEVSAFMRTHLIALEQAGRCEWRPEVRVMAFTHLGRGKPDALRLDYVASLDNGPLIGFEIKRRPERAADLGKHCVQAAQYAAGLIACQAMDRVPMGWVGQPLKAVFLAVDRRGMDEFVKNHLACAARLFGPANVGFATYMPTERSSRQELRLELSGDRWWSEAYGYRVGAMDRTIRCGSGTTRLDAAE